MTGSVTTRPAAPSSPTPATTPPGQPPAQQTAPAEPPLASAPPAAGALVEVPPPGAPPSAKTNPEAPLESGPVPVKGKWNPVLYGFVEFDAIRDSTQSFNDLAGNGQIQRPGSYGADHSRMMFGVRNSRLGFKLEAPETAGIKPSAVLEMDFFGNQPPNASEAAFFVNPTFRIRHFAIKLEDPYVDVLIGQYWQLFGWQSYFHPNTVEIQGVPGQVYSRAPQLRLSHKFKMDAVSLEVALAASRPPQRNSGLPDGQAGLKFSVNDWKGLHTAGGTGTSVDSLAIGVSGVGRHFRLPAFSASSSTAETNGWGVSVDALLPILRASKEDHANALTFTGSFVTGSGISDLYTGLSGGVSLPSSLPNGNDYTPGIDNGLVAFDADGNLKSIDWQSFILGLQYYLPPSGNVWLAVNYSHMKSANAKDYAAATSAIKTSNWVSANVFWDAFQPLRLGAEYAYFQQTYADDTSAKNHRVQISAFYLF